MQVFNPHFLEMVSDARYNQFQYPRRVYPHLQMPKLHQLTVRVVIKKQQLVLYVFTGRLQ